MRLKLPEGLFKAYLFDCDGTIADSMPLHYRAWKKALGEWNCELEEKLFYEWGGTPVAEIISTLNERDGLNMPVETVARRKEELYFELLPQLKAVPDVLEHIEAGHGRIPFGVVSDRMDGICRWRRWHGERKNSISSCCRSSKRSPMFWSTLRRGTAGFHLEWSREARGTR